MMTSAIVRMAVVTKRLLITRIRKATHLPVLALLAVLVSVQAAAAQETSRITSEEGVIYGVDQGSALLADIAYPQGRDDLPAIIYVHGGRWRAGSRSGSNALDPQEWAGFGFFAMTIDYRLVTASPAPAPYQDVLTAVRWVHAHADEYGIDEDRIYMIGNSAGGHLVSLVATLGDGPYPRTGGWEDARSDVRAVISAAATYELNTLSWGDLWEPTSGNVREARRLASPLHQISAATKPILVIHSDDDGSVPVQQAVDMARALEEGGVFHRFVHYEDRGHMGITDEVIEETRAFIAEVEARGHPDIVTEEEVVYGEDQGSALLADVAYPAEGDGLPAILYVHGGSWRGGSRNGNNALDVEEWARLGFFAMTIDYRLVLASPAPAPYQDVLTAVRWVHAHADRYGIDPDRIYLIGNSAGGHLVSLAATLGDGPYPRTGGWEEERSDVRAVISVSGAYDLETLSWGNLWSPLEGDPQEARRLASPIRQIDSNTIPMLVIHSADDEAVLVEQAERMVQDLEDAGVIHRFVRWEDRGHMGIIPEVVREARAFIATVEDRH